MGRLPLYLIIGILSVSAQALSLNLTDETEGGDFKVNFNYLIANGEIKPSDASQFKKILNKQSARSRRTVILLTSEGGLLEATPDIAKAIVEASDRLFKDHKVTNMLVINDECSSACAALLAAITQTRNDTSLEIKVLASAKFGFHSPVQKQNGKVKEIVNSRDREDAIERQMSFLRDHGVSPEWLKKNDRLFKNSKMTMIKALQLCQEKSRFIPADSCLPETVNDAVVYIDGLLASPDQHLSETK